MRKNENIVTIDGPSGTGKSTVAQALARDLQYRYLDTGAMYRTVTHAAQAAGLCLDPPVEKQICALLDRIRFSLNQEGEVLLDEQSPGEAIRSERVTASVSAVAALKGVRERLVEFQRAFGQEGRIVAEGRDMGTVVFPEAAFKFFLDADPAERARRRVKQNRLLKGTAATSEEEVLAQQEARDRFDSRRSMSPLKATVEMNQIDTTLLSEKEVVDKMLAIIRKKLDHGSRRT